MNLFDALYDISETWPQRELFRRTDQLRRAALSIPSNIAEGQGRRGSKEFLHHLSIAHGSLAEAETCVIAAHRRGYIDDADLALLLINTEDLSKMIQALMNSLELRIQKPERK
jgi:four helix bundle protein